MGKETVPEQPESESSHHGSRRARPAGESAFPPAPWGQLLCESAKAFAAFCRFRDLRGKRSYAETARVLGKHESQIRCWASRFDWRGRAHAWDLAQSREVELLLRQEREQAARRRMRDSEQMERIAMAGILKLVTRDPETGEPTLSDQLTPDRLCKLYELSLKIGRALPDAAGTPAETGDPLQSLSDPELEQVIALAKERAHPEGGSDDDSNPP